MDAILPYSQALDISAVLHPYRCGSEADWPDGSPLSDSRARASNHGHRCQRGKGRSEFVPTLWYAKGSPRECRHCFFGYDESSGYYRCPQSPSEATAHRILLRESGGCTTPKLALLWWSAVRNRSYPIGWPRSGHIGFAG